MTKMMIGIGIMIVGIIFAEFWLYEIYRAILATRNPSKLLFLMLTVLVIVIILCVFAILISFAAVGAWRGI